MSWKERKHKRWTADDYWNLWGMFLIMLIPLVVIVTLVVGHRIETASPPVQTQTIVINNTTSVPYKIKERVVFTSYWVNGNDNLLTSTGHRTSQFDVNEYGWYTYQGHVVVATATHLCIRVSSGACGPYEYQDTHHYFNFYDVIDIIIGGKTFSAIVMDSCGACNWDEDFQRVDIFVKGPSFSVGKVKGAIIY